MVRKDAPGKKEVRLSREFESHFEVRGHLGDGSTARVYELYCKKKTSYCKKGHTVALKVAKSPFESATIRNEYMQLRSLDHPNIIKVFEPVECIGERGKKVSGFIMEHCTGGSLFLHVQKNKVHESHAFSWFLQIAGAVRYLHDSNIFHRSLNTSNVLISSTSRRAILKIIDFGTYCDADYDARTIILSGDGQAAPEMKNEEKYDPRSVDIFSLGMILHSLLCYPPNGYLLPLKQVSPKCNALLAALLDQDSCKRPTIHQIFESEWFRFMGNLSSSLSDSFPPSLSLSSSSSSSNGIPISWSSSLLAQTDFSSSSSSSSSSPPPPSDDCLSSSVLISEDTDNRSEPCDEDHPVPAEEKAPKTELEIEQEKQDQEAKKIEKQKTFLERINWKYLTETSKEIMNLQSLLFLYAIDRLRPQKRHKEACALLKNILMVIKKQEKLLIKSMNLAALHSFDISVHVPQYQECLRQFEPLHVKLLAEILIEQDVIDNAPFNTGIHSSSLEVVDRAIQFYLLKAQREESPDLRKRYSQKVSGFLRWRSIASQIDPLFSSLKRVL